MALCGDIARGVDCLGSNRAAEETAHGPARTHRRGPHRVHRARPRGGARLTRRRPGVRVPVLPGALRARGQRLDGRAPGRPPARGDAAQLVLPLRRPGDLRGVLLRGARPEPRAAAQQRRRRPPRRALRRRPRRRRRPSPRLRRPRARRADREQGRARGSAVGLLPGALGDAVRAGQLSRGQGLLPQSGGVRVSELADAGVGAASQRIAAHLRESILSGEIAPGQWIRQEEVAARLGASRLPVREALRMLEAEGLTEHEANKGSRVTLLDQHEVDVVYQMRERLEPLALTESLPHLTADQVEHLEYVQERIEADVQLTEFLVLDREFHLTSYAACTSEQLVSTISRLWNTTQHHRRSFMQLGGSDRRWVVNSEHRLLLNAIRRRDTVDGERYLSGHIRRTRIEIAQHPEVFAAPPPS